MPLDRVVPPRFGRGDALILIALGLLTGALVWLAAARFDPRFLREPDGNDVWFEADLPTVADRVLHRWSDQSRNARHPLFPLLATVPAYVLRSLGLSETTALRAVIAASAAAWSAALYALLRGLTGRRLDALVFTALGHTTAAAVFWLPVPETYALGSASVMTALALCAWDPGGRFGARYYVAAAAFSLSVTTSNWLTGLSAIASRHPWRQGVQIAANSLTAVVVLWGVQRLAFPSASFFIGEGAQTRFVLPHGLAGIPEALRAQVFHAVVMPAIATVPEPKWGLILSVQHAAVASGGAAAILAAAGWMLLLGAGAWTLVTSRDPMRLPLLLAIAAHLAVYCVYGEETFLYALHIAPLLVAVAAFATRTPARPIVLGAAAGLSVMLAVHNLAAFAWALGFFARGVR